VVTGRTTRYGGAEQRRLFFAQVVDVFDIPTRKLRRGEPGVRTRLVLERVDGVDERV
jgi:hypothetical protein